MNHLQKEITLDLLELCSLHIQDQVFGGELHEVLEHIFAEKTLGNGRGLYWFLLCLLVYPLLLLYSVLSVSHPHNGSRCPKFRSPATLKKKALSPEATHLWLSQRSSRHQPSGSSHQLVAWVAPQGTRPQGQMQVIELLAPSWNPLSSRWRLRGKVEGVERPPW